MSISYIKTDKYEAYLVRVMRQRLKVAKTFRVVRSKRQALAKAKAWEAKLIKLLGDPMPTAGRVRGGKDKQFKATVRCDSEGRLFMVAHYRSATGRWKHVDRSIEKYGWVEAAQLVVEEAKRRHVVPKVVKLRPLPSDRRILALKGEA